MKRLFVILIVIGMLMVATSAFSEETYTLAGQLEWLNSPAGNLLMNCGEPDNQGVGTWSAVGNKGMRTLRFQGLYKVTDDVFEMRRQVRGNMGQPVLEMVVKGAWKIQNPQGPKITFIYVDNVEDDDQDRDVAVFKILMQQ